MKLFSHFIADQSLATHKRFDTNQLLRLKPSTHTTDFWSEICINSNGNDSENEKTEDITLLGEKVSPNSIVPVLIIFNLTYPNTVENLPYDDNFIRRATELISDSLKSVAGIPDGDDCFTTAVLTYGPRTKSSSSKEIVYSIRIQFPLCRMAVADQKRHLRPKILKNFKKENLLDSLHTKIRYPLESVVDIDYFSDSVPQYGTGYLKEGETNLTWYTQDGEETEIRDLKSLFPLDRHADFRSNGLRIPDNAQKKIKNWIPLILSMNYEAGTVYIPVSVSADADVEDKENIDIVLTEEQKNAEELLTMINLHRYKEKTYRDKIGMALHNIYKGSPEGLKLWAEYIYKSENGNKKPKHGLSIDEELSNEYEGFSNNNHRTDITLEDYVAEDNPSNHRKWLTQKCHNLVNFCLQPEHLRLEQGDAPRVAQRNQKKVATQGAIARAFYMKNRRFITYVDSKWYCFNGTYLTCIKDGPCAEINDFRKDFELYQSILVEQRNNADGVERNTLNNMIAEINDIIKNLDTETFLNAISRFLRTIITKKTRSVLLDSDDKIFAPSKGEVLESRDKDDDGNTQPMLHRKATIEDFRTKHGKVPYPKNWDMNSYWVKKSYKYDLRDHGDYPTVDFMETEYSKSMRRTNGEKKGLNWVGKPGAAKTHKKKEYTTIYGNQCFSPASTILNGERTKSGNASPENALGNNCCAIFVEEPEPTSKINEGWYCEKTGGTESHARLLHDNGDVAESTGILTIITNDGIPLSPKLQIKIRHLLVPFVAMYVPEEGNPEIGVYLPETKEERKRLHIYKKKNMKPNLNNLAMARLWRWVNRHGSIDFDDSVKVPRSIRVATTKYWNTYDYFTVFSNKNLVKTGDLSIEITVDMIYDIFRDWFIPRYRSIPVPDRNIFMVSMNGVIGLPDENEVYLGYTLVNDLYREFFNANFRTPTDEEVEENGEYVLTFPTLRKTYLSWMALYNPGARIHNNQIFLSYMKTIIGPKSYDPKRGFIGWTVERFPE